MAPSWQGLHRQKVRLSPTPASVGAARRFVRGWAAQFGGGDAAMLCVSELVSNALQHTASRFVTLTIWHDGDTVRIEVDDDSPDEPTVRVAPDGERGRGLGIVSAVTSGWGVTHHPDDGKSVWASITPGPDTPR